MSTLNEGRRNLDNKHQTGMINDEKQVVDPYLPRKCEFTNKILEAKDRSSVQINVAEVDENGKATGKKICVTLSGFVRSKGNGPEAFESVLREKGAYPISE